MAIKKNLTQTDRRKKRHTPLNVLQTIIEQPDVESGELQIVESGSNEQMQDARMPEAQLKNAHTSEGQSEDAQQSESASVHECIVLQRSCSEPVEVGLAETTAADGRPKEGQKLEDLEEESDVASDSDSFSINQIKLPDLVIGCCRFWRTISACKDLFLSMDDEPKLDDLLDSFKKHLWVVLEKKLDVQEKFSKLTKTQDRTMIQNLLSDANMLDVPRGTCLEHVHVIFPIALLSHQYVLLDEAIELLEVDETGLAFIKLCMAMATVIFLVSNYKIKTKFFKQINRELRKMQHLCAFCFEVGAEIKYNHEAKQRQWDLSHLIYRHLNDAEPYMLDWYAQRALANYELEEFEDAALDMDFYRLVGRKIIGMTMPHTYKFIENCNEMIALQEIDCLKHRSTNFLPFLTTNYLNLLISFPCNDFIADDLLAVRINEADWITDSCYKVMMTNMSNGIMITSVVDLLRDIENTDQPHRAEGYLLLSLIFARTDHSKVQKFLDAFIDTWVTEQYSVSIDRRRKIFMRYLSISLGIRKNPLKHEDFKMFSKTDLADLYMQMAFVIIWQLQIYPNTAAMQSNIRKLKTIEALCTKALKLVNLQRIRYLRAHVQYEVLRAVKRRKPYMVELKSSAEIVDSISDDDGRIFAIFCYIALCRHVPPSGNFNLYVEMKLFYPLIAIQLPNIKPVKVITDCDIEPGINFYLQDHEFQAWFASIELDLFQSSSFRINSGFAQKINQNILNSGVNVKIKKKTLAMAEIVNQYWPLHIDTNGYEILLNNLRFMKREIAIDKRFGNFRRLLLNMDQENEFLEDIFRNDWSTKSDLDLIKVSDHMQSCMRSDSKFESKMFKILEEIRCDALGKSYPGEADVPDCELPDRREQLIEMVEGRFALFEKLIQINDNEAADSHQRHANLCEAISDSLDCDLFDAVKGIPAYYARTKLGRWSVHSCFLQKNSIGDLKTFLKKR